MIRLITIGDQITQDEEGTDFAFYNTVINKFVEIDGTQVWSSWKDFVSDYNEKQRPMPLSRFESLFLEQVSIGKIGELDK